MSIYNVNLHFAVRVIEYYSMVRVQLKSYISRYLFGDSSDIGTTVAASITLPKDMRFIASS